MSDGRSKKRPGVEAQREIVTQAAVALFVERGTGAVSISQICKAADVSRPTFYRCFPDKDTLVAHVYAIAVSDHVQVNLAAVARAGPGGVQAALDEMLDRIFTRPRLAAFLFVESADASSPAFGIVQAAFADAADQIEARYAELGVTPPSRTVLTATMVACQWIVHDAIRRGLSEADRGEAKRAMGELVRAVFQLPA